ncbi:Serine phosphatase RsbU, regulator of sigma subunit [Alkalithermobacter thermoalcaliphilus JW-YL-7 = DSM 7308]|uniref:Putative PAS/PAC sensor protein n=1 Tax=Alkalithermobacter thermoalcaliphilus JW-YL-7 = DSM 7308 TaxID=1121328 RepID=A0A150FNZ1_CLOPD|nr:putative PAS/PAC sensor protein [[Clostridium] paradoxum JW-YL-7 = DSM 7308]SHK55248.1 Serine phosphatase RsbU, regulator of sigma subunit [[Clostridium] paradoxum JW-YL-7 = DSM 7308]
MLAKTLGISSVKFHKNFIEDILNGMIDWVRVIDNTGTVIYANKHMKEAVGEQLIGSSCYYSLGRKCMCEDCVAQKTIKTGATNVKEEIVGDRIFSVISSPIKDIDGNIYAVVEVFRDITEDKKLKKQIIEKNNKINKDLEFARTIQKNMLPDKGNFENVNIDYIYNPSEDLGGDIFDIFKIDDNKIGMYISDVVGHGIEASMLTMFVRQMMRCGCKSSLTPSKALERLHKNFLELKLDYDKYVTIFFAILDKKDGTLKYANAGHNTFPILFNEKDVKLLKTSGNLISPLFDKVEYEDNTINISKGDKILFYTDGLIENRNNKGEEFGLNRLIDIIKKDSKNTIQNIEKEVNSFITNKRKDDLAVLLVEYM